MADAQRNIAEEKTADLRFIAALKDRDLAAVSRMIREKTIEPNSRCHGNTLLWYATAESFPEAVECLVDAGADVHAWATSDHKSKIMHWVATFGATDCGRILVSRGADVNTIEGCESVTPLMQAIIHARGDSPHVDTFKMLLQNGANPNYARPSDGLNPLLVATRKNSIVFVKLLLEHGADPNAGFALMIAIEANQPATVEALLSHGANPNLGFDDDERWPLMFSVKLKRVEMIKLLMAHNVDVNRQSKKREAALDVASIDGNLEVVKALISPRTKLSQRTLEGSWSLMLAARYGHTEVVKVLLDAGCPVNEVRQVDQATALSMAAYHGHGEAAACLVARGSEIDHSTLDGKTALYFAAAGAAPSTVRTLMAYGAKIMDWHGMNHAAKVVQPYFKAAKHPSMTQILSVERAKLADPDVLRAHEMRQVAVARFGLPSAKSHAATQRPVDPPSFVALTRMVASYRTIPLQHFLVPEPKLVEPETTQKSAKKKKR